MKQNNIQAYIKNINDNEPDNINENEPYEKTVAYVSGISVSTDGSYLGRLNASPIPV